jgi:hypothetical protein
VRLEAETVSGAAVGEAVLTCPAVWGARRQQVLLQAAQLAGLPDPVLLPEPVAAARHYVASDRGLHDRGLRSQGQRFIVYDLGAGTFDCTAMDGGPTFTVLASGGLPDAGGLDVDAAIMAYLAAVYANRSPDLWRQLEQPGDAAQRRHSRQLWEDIREAKEVLSRASATVIHIPVLEVEAPLGREQLDRLARPLLGRTVAAVRGLLRDAGVSATDTALLLVGGASRMPLVATALHQELGVPPFVLEQPELAVALGSVAEQARRAATAQPAEDDDAESESEGYVGGEDEGYEGDEDEGYEGNEGENGEEEQYTYRQGQPHLIHLMLPHLEGYTLRRYTREVWTGTAGWVGVDVEFLTDEAVVVSRTGCAGGASYRNSAAATAAGRRCMAGLGIPGAAHGRPVSR